MAKKALGTFPQMVTAQALEAIKPHFTRYAECREPNKAFEFVSRFDGRPCPFVVGDGTLKWSTAYYPSAQTHQTAFELVEPSIEKMMASSRDRR